MDTQKFIENIEQQFDDLTPNTLTLETRFREIDGWSSLQAMLIIAMVNVEYDVTLTGENIKKAQTLNDIYQLVNSPK
jgi:acyl carrier protein